jgi:protein TonB
MLQDAMFVPGHDIRARAAAIPISVLIHAVAILALVTVPLLRMGDLPRPELTAVFLAPPPPVPPPAPPKGSGRPAAAAANRIKPVRAVALGPQGPLVSPVAIPSEIQEEPLAGGGWEEGIDGGVDYGKSPGFGRENAFLPSWLVAISGGDPAPASAPVREVRPPRLVRRVEPDYPEVARLARVEGVVILEATTDVLGRVKDVKILRSVPLLDPAALDAVRQWLYEPMIVNGRPREVAFTVTLNFQLK